MEVDKDTVSDEDIYSDLPEFDYVEKISKLEKINSLLQERVSKLENQLKIITKQNIDIKNKYKIVSKNISSLYKTAKSEIQRKDRMLADLNRRFDDAAFRRNGYLDNTKSREPANFSNVYPQIPRIRQAQIEQYKPEVLETIFFEPGESNFDEDSLSEENNKTNKVRGIQEENVLPKNVTLLTEYSRRMYRKIYGKEITATIASKETTDANLDKENTQIETSTIKQHKAYKIKEVNEVMANGHGEITPASSSSINKGPPKKSFEPDLALRIEKGEQGNRSKLLGNPPEVLFAFEASSNSCKESCKEKTSCSTSNVDPSQKLCTNPVSTIDRSHTISSKSHKPGLESKNQPENKVNVSHGVSSKSQENGTVGVQIDEHVEKKCDRVEPSGPEERTPGLKVPSIFDEISSSEEILVSKIKNSDPIVTKPFSIESSNNPTLCNNSSLSPKPSDNQNNLLGIVGATSNCPEQNQSSRGEGLEEKKSSEGLSSGSTSVVEHSSELSPMEAPKDFPKRSILNKKVLNSKIKGVSVETAKKGISNGRTISEIRCNSKSLKHSKVSITPISVSWAAKSSAAIATPNVVSSKPPTLANNTHSKQVLQKLSQPLSIDMNSVAQTQKKLALEEYKNKLVETIFGSPIKWADNESSSEGHKIDVSSPTLYDDSCSSHLEQPKSSLNQNRNESEINSKTNFRGDSGGLTTTAPLGIVSISTDPDKSQTQNAQKATLPKDLGKENNNKFGFSSNSVDQRKATDEKSLARPFQTVSVRVRYEDSILGQFEDTTQFISALTHVHSTISPINTPCKEDRDNLQSRESSDHLSHLVPSSGPLNSRSRTAQASASLGSHAESLEGTEGNVSKGQEVNSLKDNVSALGKDSIEELPSAHVGKSYVFDASTQNFTNLLEKATSVPSSKLESTSSKHKIKKHENKTTHPSPLKVVSSPKKRTNHILSDNSRSKELQLDRETPEGSINLSAVVRQTIDLHYAGRKMVFDSNSPKKPINILQPRKTPRKLTPVVSESLVRNLPITEEPSTPKNDSCTTKFEKEPLKLMPSNVSSSDNSSKLKHCNEESGISETNKLIAQSRHAPSFNIFESNKKSESPDRSVLTSKKGLSSSSENEKKSPLLNKEVALNSTIFNRVSVETITQFPQMLHGDPLKSEARKKAETIWSKFSIKDKEPIKSPKKRSHQTKNEKERKRKREEDLNVKSNLPSYSPHFQKKKSYNSKRTVIKLDDDYIRDWKKQKCHRNLKEPSCSDREKKSSERAARPTKSAEKTNKESSAPEQNAYSSGVNAFVRTPVQLQRTRRLNWTATTPENQIIISHVESSSSDRSPSPEERKENAFDQHKFSKRRLRDYSPTSKNSLGSHNFLSNDFSSPKNTVQTTGKVIVISRRNRNFGNRYSQV